MRAGLHGTAPSSPALTPFKPQPVRPAPIHRVPQAGQAMPPYAADLRGAALLFDEVRYGQRAGSRPGYDRIAELDTRISASAGRAGWRAVQPVADGVTP